MRLLAAATIAFLFVAGPLAAEPPSYGSINKTLADAVIMPAYADYAAAMADLAPAIEPYCTEPDEAGLESARQGFTHAMKAWQRVQPVAFGPVLEDGRASRVQFWPDKHGTAGRQLRQALAEEDPALIDGGVAGKSAALQSLASLEVLLFGEPEGPSAYGCELAVAIGRFQGDLAAEVLAAWRGEGGFYESFTGADDGNDQFYDAAEAHTALFKAMLANLDVIVAQKLERPLDDKLEDARPKRAESWRSERSLDNIAANLETIQALYVADGGLNLWLQGGGLDSLNELMGKLLTEALATADGIGMPLEQAVGNADARPGVEALLAVIKRLRVLIATSLADAAGVTLGFNATDGD
ncbi:MAG: imelysin family protein [Alphaproteobacteria bacterium]